jgi:CRP-like cAMP-binding protein
MSAPKGNLISPEQRDRSAQGLGRERRVVFAFPRDDALFRRTVERQIASLGPEGDMVGARRTLRRSYANADLHLQRDVVINRDPSDVWFAFRDGRLSPLHTPEPWWESRGTATCDLDGGGALSAANSKARSLLGLPVGRGALALLVNLVGARLADQMTSTGGDLATVGTLTSVLAFRLPWGRAEPIEMHAVRNGAGTSSHRLSFRSMGDRDEDAEQLAVDRSSLHLASAAACTAALRGRMRRVLAPGERLAEGIAGEPWMALVVAGIVRVYMNVEDNEPTVGYGSDGALVGTRWIGTDADVAVGLEAVTPSIIVQLDAHRIEQLIEADQTFALAVLEEGRGVARDLALSYASAVGTKLPERLARELIVLADLQPGEPYLAVTEQQLADGIGTIRESIGRTIADFRRRSWLATTRYGIILLEPRALRRLAKLPVPSASGSPPRPPPGSAPALTPALRPGLATPATASSAHGASAAGTPGRGA